MPTSMDLNQLTPSVPQQSMVANQYQQQADQHNTAVQGLANQMQQVQNMKTQQQALQQQIDDGKVSSFQKRAQLALSAPKTLKGKMLDQLGDWMGKNGMDPQIADGLKDEDFAQSYNTALAANGKNPIPSGDMLQALSSWNAFQPGVSQVAESYQKQAEMAILAKLKADTQSDIAKTKDETARRGQDLGLQKAQIGADARINAASQAGGWRMTNSLNSINNSYSREMKDTENGINQADRALGLLSKIDSGELKSTKTLSADVNNAVASLLANGRPSTVYGQQATHADDLYERVKNGFQFISAEPQNTQAPAKLEQLKKDVEALRDFYGEQHSSKYTSWREGIPEQARQGIDNRFSTFRKAHGLDAGMGDQAASTAAPAPPPKMSEAMQNYVKAAQGRFGQKYSVDQIVQMGQQQGIK